MVKVDKLVNFKKIVLNFENFDLYRPVLSIQNVFSDENILAFNKVFIMY